MLKDRISIDYIVLLMHELRDRRATSSELSEKLQHTHCSSPTYTRKILIRMANSGMVKASGSDGYSLTKPYADYTLADVLEATGSVALHESPASRGEDKLMELAKAIKASTLV